MKENPLHPSAPAVAAGVLALVGVVLPAGHHVLGALHSHNKHRIEMVSY